MQARPSFVREIQSILRKMTFLYCFWLLGYSLTVEQGGKSHSTALTIKEKVRQKQRLVGFHIYSKMILYDSNVTMTEGGHAIENCIRGTISLDETGSSWFAFWCCCCWMDRSLFSFPTKINTIDAINYIYSEKWMTMALHQRPTD